MLKRPMFSWLRSSGVFQLEIHMVGYDHGLTDEGKPFCDDGLDVGAQEGADGVFAGGTAAKAMFGDTVSD